jgi:hypothetical protein
VYRGLDDVAGNMVETEHVIGPLDFSQGGRELVSRWFSDIDSDDTFFTGATVIFLFVVPLSVLYFC